MSDSRARQIPETPPNVVARPRAAVWFYERGMGPAEIAPIVGKGYEQCRRYLLPFDDALHVPAPLEVIATLRDWSGGLLTADDWMRPPKPALTLLDGGRP